MWPKMDYYDDIITSESGIVRFLAEKSIKRWNIIVFLNATARNWTIKVISTERCMEMEKSWTSWDDRVVLPHRFKSFVKKILKSRRRVKINTFIFLHFKLTFILSHLRAINFHSWHCDKLHTILTTFRLLLFGTHHRRYQ